MDFQELIIRLQEFGPDRCLIQQPYDVEGYEPGHFLRSGRNPEGRLR